MLLVTVAADAAAVAAAVAVVAVAAAIAVVAVVAAGYCCFIVLIDSCFSAIGHEVDR